MENIRQAITGLKQYLDAMSEMDNDEFDILYNNCVKADITNIDIAKLVISLEKEITA